MRLNWLAIALTGIVALCVQSCSTTRRISAGKSEELRIKSDVVATTDETDFTDVRDTLQEVTTITIDRNDRGDTLRIATVTDRTRSRERDRFRVQDSRIMVKTDTVYIERRDSSFVSNTNFTNDTNSSKESSGNALHRTLKWVFAIILALIALRITMRVCRRG